MTLIMKKRNRLSDRIRSLYRNRNMQSFIDLLVDNKLNISGLITHSFDLTSAIEAYDLIVEK